MSITIITHGGMAHMDDFMSVCMLAAKFDGDVNVYRRDPKPEELADPNIYVVDVGKKHQPELNNYDHHQLPRDPAKCALTLLEERFGWGLANLGWFGVVELRDVSGPKAVADKFGFQKYPYFMQSPVEKSMMAMFQKCYGHLAVDHDLIKMMTKIGEDIRCFAADMDVCLSELPNLAKLTYVDIPIDPQETATSIMVIEDGDITGFQSFATVKMKVKKQLERKSGTDVMCAIYPNRDRNTNELDGGWVLERFENHEDVNFHRMRDVVDEMQFVFPSNAATTGLAHDSGWFAITKPMGIKALEALLNKTKAIQGGNIKLS